MSADPVSSRRAAPSPLAPRPAEAAAKERQWGQALPAKPSAGEQAPGVVKDSP
ncbi:MAG: hypothetical protein R3A44_13200 [Caldilineaceae bacterium]